MAIQGKSGENYRYVFTKIDKRPRYLIMSKCNFCPFMINDFHNGYAKCGKFINSNQKQHYSSNFIQTVYGYMQKGYGSQEMEILTRIQIPDWCGLPNHLTKISPNDIIYSIVNGKLFTESGQNYANTIQIISDDEIQYSRVDYESLVLVAKKDKYIHYGKNNVSDAKVVSDDKIETKICSSCGKHKEKINRDKRDGMCDACWTKYKKNKKKRYQTKINNFRLKRKVDWTDEEYKLVKI